MKREAAVILLEFLLLALLLGAFCYRRWNEEKRTENSSVSVEQASGWETKTVRGAASDQKTGDGEEDFIKIALTFDDGPHPFYTEQLLDGLKERGVAATFFVTGEHASLHPDVIERMHEEGHLIGNHTYSHIQLKSTNRETFKEELVKTNQVIREITGEEILFVRPPYGTWDKALEEELNMIPVLWNIDPLDWCSKNVSCIVQRVTSKARENAVILLHDYYETTVTAALQIVDSLLEQGYTFVTVDEILLE